MTENNLNGKIVIITGGAGMLGKEYTKAVEAIGGIPIILDIYDDDKSTVDPWYYKCDITKEENILKVLEDIKKCEIPIYGLINNAAIDPKFDAQGGLKPTIENYPIEHFMKELEVSLKGTLLCTKIFGKEMIKNKEGSIINISSLLGIVAPNQSFYRELGSIKPIGYTTVKHAIIGMTKHIATEWAIHGIRCNALAPNGVYNNHPQEFVEKLTKFIPMKRMAQKNEYNSAIQFLLTDNSRYMTGHTLIMDGGHSIW